MQFNRKAARRRPQRYRRCTALDCDSSLPWAGAHGYVMLPLRRIEMQTADYRDWLTAYQPMRPTRVSEMPDHFMILDMVWGLAWIPLNSSVRALFSSVRDASSALALIKSGPPCILGRDSALTTLT